MILKTIELYTLNRQVVLRELHFNKAVSKRKKKIVSHATARMIPYRVSLSLKYSQGGVLFLAETTQALPWVWAPGMVLVPLSGPSHHTSLLHLKLHRCLPASPCHRAFARASLDLEHLSHAIPLPSHLLIFFRLWCNHQFLERGSWSLREASTSFLVGLP